MNQLGNMEHRHLFSGANKGKSWSEDDLVPLSALEHYAYCPRQCALIHVEQAFEENVFTLKGRAIHELVDEPGTETDVGMRLERALPLWCNRLGLVGKADIVEFHDGVPYPVDYKHGPKGRAKFASYQLCGQALCLEEMLGKAVPKGAIFYHKSRRRTEILFTDQLRIETENLSTEIRGMLSRGEVPDPVNDTRCPNCSLVEICMPALAEKSRIRKLSEGLFQIPIDTAPVTHPKDKDCDTASIDRVNDPVRAHSQPPDGDL